MDNTRNARLSLKTFIMQWVIGGIVNDCVSKLRKYSLLHANGPICNIVNKDSNNVLQFQYDSIFDLRLNLLIVLKVWLNSMDTHFDISPF